MFFSPLVLIFYLCYVRMQIDFPTPLGHYVRFFTRETVRLLETFSLFESAFASLYFI